MKPFFHYIIWSISFAVASYLIAGLIAQPENVKIIFWVFGWLGGITYMQFTPRPKQKSVIKTTKNKGFNKEANQILEDLK